MAEPDETAGAVVVVDHLNQVFETRGEPLVALDDISLRLGAGEFVAVVGPSGCGKSTLLRVVAGLDHASDGTITIDDVPIDGPSERSGVVFQRPALFPWLNVLDNVTFRMRMHGESSAKSKAAGRHYLVEVGLEGFEDYPIYNLSGGMQHRVALARALISRPALLLMDEPFGALDAQTRTTMQELLTQIWQDDRSTVLFITHDVDEALTLADRVIVMTRRPGRIKVEVPVTLPRPRDLDVTTSEEFGALKRQIVEAIRDEVRANEARDKLAARQAERHA